MAILQLKAKHFKNTTFGEPQGCPIYKAALDQFKLPKNIHVAEGVNHLTIGAAWHRHTPYYNADYEHDYEVAKKKKFDDTTIRLIHLPTYEPV